MRIMTARNLQILTALIGIVLTVVFGQYLPERVATHFSYSGQPNAWSSNLTNTLFFCGMFAFINLLFLAIPWLLRKLPVSLINMPNREYWFVAERRENSILRVGAHMAEFGIGVNIFLMGVEYLTFLANRSAVAISPASLIVTGSAFLLFMIIWVVRFVRAFRLPKN